MYDEDSALGDEDVEDSLGGAGSRPPASQDARGAADLGDDAEDLDGSGSEASVPCRLNVVVEKAGKGALNIEAIAQDGNIVVDNLYYYPDADMAHSTSAEVAHKAQDLYPGPPFGSLDEDLQILMERYLEERGVTQALAVFVPDYMDLKEQREYLAWLNKVKSFVDA
jgi:complement component 1 Q subcomponent-binding protein